MVVPSGGYHMKPFGSRRQFLRAGLGSGASWFYCLLLRIRRPCCVSFNVECLGSHFGVMVPLSAMCLRVWVQIQQSTYWSVTVTRDVSSVSWYGTGSELRDSKKVSDVGLAEI